MNWISPVKKIWITSPLTIFILIFGGAGAMHAQEAGKSTSAPVEGKPGPVPVGQKCVTCHAEIVRSYGETTMAKASGGAMEALIPGDFLHTASGVHYRIYEEQGKAWLSFERGNGESLEGKRQLLYFIGSGGRGRTYLFSEDGYAFEAPVNWYSQSKKWDMTPAYKSTTNMPLNLPAAMSCIHCHTSGFQAPAAGTENKYPEPLFTEQGISCERCHGSIDPHDTNNGKTLNPAKLTPAKRDAICMQCHLEGNAAIEQPGKHLYEFKPGDDLSDYVHYLVLSTESQANPRAVSQFEALAQSVCKRKSGDNLHCSTCHDPHHTPAPAERVNYFRAKCLACHGESFGQKHHAKNPDCVSCHMPKVVSSDVAHTQATDHRILRQAGREDLTAPSTPAARPKLERFPPQAGAPSDRDLVLGWLALAQAGRDFAEAEEEKLLPVAAKEYPQDAAILSAYAYRELIRRNTQHARELYEAALRIDPLSVDAAVNLGVIEAQSGSLERVLALWKGAFQRAPWRSSIGMNLARLDCNLGNKNEAELSLRRVLQFNPDLPEASRMLHQIESETIRCGAH